MKRNKYSDYKILNFPEKIKSFQSGEITAPLYVRIKPTNHCSHACHWCCYSDGTKRDKDRPGQHLQSRMHEDMLENSVMSIEKGLELINDIGDMGVKAVTFSGGGEPLIYPHIVELMKRVLFRGIDLSIITNGQSLSGERANILTNAKWVRVSIDYTSAKEMAESRNVPERFFDDVLRNIQEFSKKKINCDLGVNFIVTRTNHKNLFSFASILKESGVGNVRFSPVYVQNFQEYHTPIQKRVEEQLLEAQSLCDERFSVNSTYRIDSPSKLPVRPMARCLYGQTVPVVGADLGVYMCHNGAYSAKHKIGDIKEKRFKEMWFSQETKDYFNEFDPRVRCANMECANQSKVVLFNQLSEMSIDNFV